MNWFLIALIPPALWSVTNHFDKYLLSKYFKSGGVGALMIFSSLTGLFLLPIIILLHPEVLRFNINSLLIALNGFLNILASLPYFYALQKDDTSITVPLFQLIPVFTYTLAYLFLGETLQTNQIVGGLLIIIGAIGIVLKKDTNHKINFKKEVLFLMVLSSILFSLNFIFFKAIAIKEASFWWTSFWEYTGFSFLALLLFLFIKPYREEFIQVIKKNRVVVLGLNGINEVINIIAKISFNFASLLTPITLTWVANGFQPFFVFIYGIMLTLFFPKITKENISTNQLIQKFIAISIMFVGSWLINR